MASLAWDCNDIYIITDMPDKDEVIKTLRQNDIKLSAERIFCADYKKYGELAKAVLLKELEIDFLIDDFGGYVQWDSQLGPAPIRLLVAPDPFRPYWHKEWKCEGGDFGRSVCPRIITKF